MHTPSATALAPRLSGDPTPTPFLPRTRRDEPRLPMPTDDEVPQETIHALAQGCDALLRLVGAVFRAASEIVSALLRLVQSVAGREVAEAVDGRVAGALGPLAPRGSGGGKGRAERDPEPARPEPQTLPADARLRAGVREVLLTYAETGAERAAVSPAFVDVVTAGVRFVVSVERQFPGAIAVLQARAPERGGVPPEVVGSGACGPCSGGDGAAPDAGAPPDAPREAGAPVVSF